MDLAGESARIRTVGSANYGDLMTDAHTRIDSLKEDIRQIGCTVLDLQAKAAAHDSKLEQVLAIQLAHGVRFDHIDARLDRVDPRLEGMGTRLDGLDTRLDGLDTQLDGMGTRLDGLESELDARFASQDSRFDRVDALLAEVLSRLSKRQQ